MLVGTHRLLFCYPSELLVNKVSWILFSFFLLQNHTKRERKEGNNGKKLVI